MKIVLISVKGTKMNLCERICELGYHAIDNPYELSIYLHGNFICGLYRFEKNHEWINKYGKQINLSNIKSFMEREIFLKNPK